MNTKLFFRKGFLILTTISVLFLSNCIVHAQITEDEKNIVNSVRDHLLSALEFDHGKFPWPPPFEIIDTKEINAFAAFKDETYSSYVVIITTGILKDLIKNNEDGLAFILGHELSHIKCGHLQKYINQANSPRNKSTILAYAFTREEEKEADEEGMKLMLKAGYSYKKAVEFIRNARSALGDYIPMEALSVDHPSWTQRLEYLDQENKNIWSSMSAFQNGLYFLMYENYPVAISCFQSVVKEFPNCYEAFANLGYAYLMQYYDGFDLEDVKNYNIGQIVVGGFYRRPASLESEVRGTNEDIWWQAIGNLQKSLVINPNQPLVKANLAIAYLLDPRRSSNDKYAKFMDESLKEMAKDSSVSSYEKSITFLNASAAEISRADYQTSTARWDSSSSYMKDFSSTAFKGANLVSFNSPSSIYSALSFNYSQIQNALNLNAIILRLKQFDEKYDQQVSDALVDYLQYTNTSSVWWKYAYDLYANYCKHYGVQLAAKKSLRTNYVDYVPVTSILVNNNVNVYLSQKISNVVELLGQPEKLPIVNGSRLYRYKFPKFGLELIGQDEVIAICVNGSNSPVVSMGIPSKTDIVSFKVGMFQKDYVSKTEMYPKAELMLDNNSVYEFNYEIGLAFRLQNNKVQEIVIVQCPIRQNADK